MSDDGTTPGYAGAGNPVAERMQALLSRAVEDQLSEQRTVANALAEVRAQVAAVGEGLRGAASGVAVERLRTDLSGVATELRMSTTGLGERFDVLARRLDEQSAAMAAAGSGSADRTAELTARLDAVAADVAEQGAGVQRLSAAVSALAAFPEALAALQNDLAGLHDRLSPLADVRAAVGDLQARGSVAEAVRPELEALSARVGLLASAADVDRVRDSVVASLTERIDGRTERPAVSPEELTEALAPLRSGLAELAAGGPAADHITAVDGRLHGLETLLGQLGDRLSHVGDAAGGIPAVATDLHRLTEQVEALGGLAGELAAVRQQVGGVSALTTEVTGLRQDVEDLGSRVAGLAVPSTEEIAAAVAARLADRLVDQLAPRIADVVLERIGPRVAEQVGDVATKRVLAGVESSTSQAEARLRTHMDEAILTLAEALLHKRRPSRSWATEAAADEDDDDEQGEPVPPLAPTKAPAPAPAATARRAAPPPSLAVQDDDEPTVATEAIDVAKVTDATDATEDAEDAEDEPASDEPDTAPTVRAVTLPEPPRPAPAPGPTSRLPHGDVLPAGTGSRGGHPLDRDEDDDDDGARRRPWWRPGG